MKNIDAGDLRHRVTVYRDTSTATGGQVKTQYAAIGTYYALVECLGGSESPNAGQVKGLLNYRVTLRASAGPLRPTDRMAWNGHTLNLTVAVPDPFGIHLTVDCTEQPPTQ